MEQLRSKTGNPFEFFVWFLSVFITIIMCPCVSNKTYHSTGLDQLYARKKVGLEIFAERTLCQLMEQLQPKTGNSLAIFWFLCVFINIISS